MRTRTLKEKIENHQRDEIQDKAPERRFNQSKQNAKHRQLEWKIPFKTFKRLIETPCSFCGKVKLENGVGLDRIDTKKGYILSNVIPCCYICNMMKGCFPDWMFLDQVKKIYRNLRRTK